MMRIDKQKTTLTIAHTGAPGLLLIAALALWLIATAVVVNAVGAEPALTDKAITNEVETEFIFDSAVPENDIDVTTNDGIVTLTGTVSDLLAKNRAGEIAETIRGVRAVINRIDVKPMIERTAAEVRRNVEDALVLDPATDSYEISVAATSGGMVTLTGTVDSWPEKQLCQTVAEDVAGVTEVKNEIKVTYDTNRPDSEIKPEIEQRLHWDVLLNNALIDVGVKNGNVSLSGSVGSAAEKTRATWDAWVAGVKSVDASKLEVVPLARDENMRTYEDVVRPDDQIQSAVKDAFLYDPRVFSFDVTPTVSSGVVTLEGIVDNAKAKLAAQQDARNTVGVIDVNNRIKVRSETTLPDPTIARNVRRVLMLDPILERYAITVEVVGGVVHLYGDVDTYFDKMRAEDLAYNSRGVTGVRNHLNVEFQEPYTKSPYIYPYWSYGYPSNTGTAAAANPQKSDRQITADIESQLWWDPFIDEDEVDVTVKDGVATLTGTVDNWAEYDAASRSAFEGGASQVINKVKIR